MSTYHSVYLGSQLCNTCRAVVLCMESASTPENLETSDNTSGTLRTPPQTLLCQPANEKEKIILRYFNLKKDASLVPLNFVWRISFFKT